MVERWEGGRGGGKKGEKKNASELKPQTYVRASRVLSPEHPREFPAGAAFFGDGGTV